MNLPFAFARALLGLFVLAFGLSAPVLARGAFDADLPGEVLLKLRSTDGLAPLLSRYPLTLVSRFGARPIYRLKIVGTADLKTMVGQLALEPEVMIAETNPEAQSPEARKNIPWAVGDPTAYVAQWAPQALRLPQAHARTTGAGVRVAVLDTGIDANHPLFAGRLLPGFDFVDFDSDPSETGSVVNAGYGHGTHVAGLVTMVAPGARIMPLRVLDAEGVGNAWVLAEAMLYAVDPDGNPETNDGAHIINLSLGSLARTRVMASISNIVSCGAAIAGDAVADRSDPGYADDETRCARRPGAMVVAAAGNDASVSVKEYPAAESQYGLASVAASSALQRLAVFSNSGPWIDLAAPGEGITSAFPGGGWATWSGTSMAAPLVAGVGALVRSGVRSIAPRDIVRRLTRTASVLCGTSLTQVDAWAALTDTRPASGSCR